MRRLDHSAICITQVDTVRRAGTQLAFVLPAFDRITPWRDLPS